MKPFIRDPFFDFRDACFQCMLTSNIPGKPAPYFHRSILVGADMIYRCDLDPDDYPPRKGSSISGEILNAK
jgi:hypothetical protein